MKNLLILFTLVMCIALMAQSNKMKIKTPAEKLSAAWAALKRSKDTTAMLITQVKQLATQKIVYRTKLVERTDTVWRIDTCIRTITAIDSASIAIMFRQRDTARATTHYKKVFFFFRKKVNPN